MSYSYDGGQRSHGGGGGGRRDDKPRDWTPAELAEHARHAAGNVRRGIDAVRIACAEVRDATTAAAQAAAKRAAISAVESLRTVTIGAATLVSQASDPEVAETLTGAATALATAEAQVAEVVAVPAVVEAPAMAPGRAAFIAALPAADGPRRQEAPAQIARLRAVIETQLVFDDLDPLARALTADADVRARFERLSELARTKIVEHLTSKTLRYRLLDEHNERARAPRGAAVAAAAAAAVPVAADGPDPIYAVAEQFGAQFGVAPRLATGEAGRAATEPKGARGVATGDVVAIHPDVDPATTAGKQVVIHELVHQAQAQLPAEQDAGRAPAEAEAAALAAQAASGGAVAKPTFAIDLRAPAADNDAPYDTANDRSAARFLNEANARGTNITAREYLRAHLVPHVLPAISNHVARQRYGLPERMTWADSDRSFGAEVIALIDDVFGGDAMYGIPDLLAGTSPDAWTLIDQTRPMIEAAGDTFGQVFEQAPSDPRSTKDLKWGPKGTSMWRAEVGTSIASRFHQGLVASLARVAARYIAAFDAHSIESGGSTAPRKDVTPSDLVPSAPMDRLVARVLPRGMVSVSAAKHGESRADAHTKTRRIKELVWLAEPGMWNWVRVVDPPDATPEEVAWHLWKDYSAAHKLEAKAPLFGLTAEDAAEFPEARAHQGVTTKDPALAKRQSRMQAHVTGDRAESDRRGQLARSAAGADLTAERERAAHPERMAATVDEAVAAPHDAAEAYGQVVEQLDALIRLAHPLGLAGALSPLRLRAQLKAGQVATLPPGAAERELLIASAQRDFLRQVGPPLAQLVSQASLRGGAPGAAPRLAIDLVRVAALSETPDAARDELIEVLQAQRVATSDSLEALLASAMQRIEQVRIHLGQPQAGGRDAMTADVAGSVRSGAKKSGAVFGADLRSRYAALHAHVLEIRAQFQAGAIVPSSEVTMVAQQIDALAFEAETLSQLAGVTGVMPTLDEMSHSGWQELLLDSDNDFGDLYGQAIAIAGELEGAHREWLAVVAAIDEVYDDEPRAKRIERAAAELARIRASIAKIGQRGEVIRFFQTAYGRIRSGKKQEAFAKLAVYLGITIVSMGVGSAVGGAMGAGTAQASIAALAAETLTNVALTTMVSGGDFKEELIANTLSTIAAMGTLRGGQTLFKATRLGRVLTAARGGRAVSQVAMNAIAAVAGMEVDSLARGDGTLDVATLWSQSPHTIALLVGQAVAARTMHGTMAHLEAMGERGRALVKQRRALSRRAEALARTPDPEQAIALLRDERAHYEQEAAALHEVLANPEALGASRASPEALRARLDGLENMQADVDATALGQLDMLLGGLKPVIDGYSYKGSTAEVGRAVGHLRREGFHVEVAPGNDGSIVTAVSPDGTTRFEILEVRAAGEAVVPDGVPRAVGAGEPTRRGQANDGEGAAARRDGAATEGDSAPRAEDGDGRASRTKASGEDERKVVPADDALTPERDPFSARGQAENAAVIAKGEPGYNAIVGTAASEAVGVELLQRLSRGDATALVELGVVVGKDFDPRTREWGLGRWEGKYIVVAGEGHAVDWRPLEGVEPIAHSHPLDVGRQLHHGNRRIDLEQITSSSNRMLASLVLSSPHDIAFLVERRLSRHTVAVPYEHLGGSEIMLATPGAAKRPAITIDIEGATYLGSLGTPPSLRYGADLIVKAGGQPIWRAQVDAVFPSGGKPFLEFNAPRAPSKPPFGPAGSPAPKTRSGQPDEPVGGGRVDGEVAPLEREPAADKVSEPTGAARERGTPADGRVVPTAPEKGPARGQSVADAAFPMTTPWEPANEGALVALMRRHFSHNKLKRIPKAIEGLKVPPYGTALAQMLMDPRLQACQGFDEIVRRSMAPSAHEDIAAELHTALRTMSRYHDSETTFALGVKSEGTRRSDEGHFDVDVAAISSDGSMAEGEQVFRAGTLDVENALKEGMGKGVLQLGSAPTSNKRLVIYLQGGTIADIDPYRAMLQGYANEERIVVDVNFPDGSQHVATPLPAVSQAPSAPAGGAQ
ncbi:MAG: DUF4157 domain-containing protein [Myxococcales bacterium]|nr:DUF4157 domain-containing protein [Myxococcales bacterium]